MKYTYLQAKNTYQTLITSLYRKNFPKQGNSQGFSLLFPTRFTPIENSLNYPEKEKASNTQLRVATCPGVMRLQSSTGYKIIADWLANKGHHPFTFQEETWQHIING